MITFKTVLVSTFSPSCDVPRHVKITRRFCKWMFPSSDVKAGNSVSELDYLERATLHPCLACPETEQLFLTVQPSITTHCCDHCAIVCGLRHVAINNICILGTRDIMRYRQAYLYIIFLFKSRFTQLDMLKKKKCKEFLILYFVQMNILLALCK